jgi:hypothetical protein
LTSNNILKLWRKKRRTKDRSRGEKKQQQTKGVSDFLLRNSNSNTATATATAIAIANANDMEK